jgi:hypothetical protein
VAIPKPIPHTHTVTTALTEAEENRRRRDYIVYPIIPRQEITLIGGSPRVGTTSLLIQMAGDFMAGRPVLGFPCYTRPSCVIVANHTKGVMHRIAHRTGTAYDDLDIRISGLTDNKKQSFQELVKTEKKRNPNLEVIFLDGFHRLFRGNRSDYDTGTEGTDAIQCTLETFDVTLVTVSRATKRTADNDATPAIERVYGSIGVTERIGTFISMERVSLNRTDANRRIVIETQDQPILQDWQFTQSGILVPKDQISSAERQASTKDDAEDLIFSHDDGTEWTSGELAQLISDCCEVCTRQAQRYVEDWMETGKIQSPRRGVYRLPTKQ